VFEVAEMYAKLVGGQIDGVKYSDKVARNITKEILGPDKYKIFTKNADKPVKSAATFTHKMLRAPAIKSAQKSVAKTAGKTAAKAGAKSIMKKIPIIAGLAGVAFGIQRAMEGDLMGAGLEIASGIMGATGVGGGLGLAIDGYLLGRDLGMMNKGGLVPGRGENKDTVPTLLTPGEFIMNRNAVDNIGGVSQFSPLPGTNPPLFIIPKSLPSKYPSIANPRPPPTPVAPIIPDAISRPAPIRSPSIARWIPNATPAKPAIIGIFFIIDFAPAFAAVFPAVFATDFCADLIAGALNILCVKVAADFTGLSAFFVKILYLSGPKISLVIFLATLSEYFTPSI
jgi:hypothetical protein